MDEQRSSERNLPIGQLTITDNLILRNTVLNIVRFRLATSSCSRLGYLGGRGYEHAMYLQLMSDKQSVLLILHTFSLCFS